MKKRLIYLLLGCIVMVVATCDVLHNEPIRPDESQDTGGFFGGKWTWVRTDGNGFAGPYTSDSTQTGYSVRYDFDSTTLQTWHNQAMDKHYTYTYTESADSTKQILTLKENNGAEYEYLWKRLNVQKDGTRSAILILSNPIPCCDNDFSIILRRIGANATPLN